MKEKEKQSIIDSKDTPYRWKQLRDVYLYLKYLLMKTPTKDAGDDDLEKLCPWNPECQEAIEKMKVEHYNSITESR